MRKTTTIHKAAALFLLAVALLIIAMAGCDELVTEVNEVTIAGNPTADFDITDTTRYFCCAPCSVEFVDLSNGTRDGWLWRFGDGDSSTDTTPSHTYDTAGVYTVTLTVSNSETDGADAEVKKHFLIIGTSIQGLSASVDSGCVPLEVAFAPVAAGGESSFSWDFGDGAAADTARQPTHTYASPGRYEVTLTVTGDCGVASVSDSIIVSDCPAVEFVVSDTVTTTLCRGDSVTFIDITSPDESLLVDFYRWDFGDGTEVTLGDDSTLVTEATHAYSNSGIYDVSMTTVLEDGNEFTSVREDYITVLDSANAGFTPTKTLTCYDPARQFLVLFERDCDTLCAGDSTLWDFGDGTTDTVFSPVHAFVAPGVYNVSLIVWGCGSDTASTTITVTDEVMPAFTITPGNSGDTTTVFELTDVSGGLGVSRNWDLGDGSATLTADVINHKYSNPGVYEVTLQLDNACGTFVAIDTITVIATK